MSEIQYMTREGYTRLKDELEELRTTGRMEAARAIAEARDKGDLSENAEYDAAKEAQGMLELKIAEMEKVLSAARIIDESQVDHDRKERVGRMLDRGYDIRVGAHGNVYFRS